MTGVQTCALPISGYIKATGATTTPYLTATGSATDVNMGLYTKGAGAFQFRTNFGTLQFNVAHTASAVNYVQVTGNSTGNDPQISAQGSDANIYLTLIAKGSNGVLLKTRGGGTPRVSLSAVDNGSASVNFLQVSSNIASSAPILSSQGSDTNIDLALTPKGTGYVKVNAGTGLGYGTGVGGAVTQATSRTTGVTLNFPCGAITLVSAAGTTSWQTFTVTNSAVAATDTIVVNQKSGTDLYQIFVTNVAAGSFKITFATTGGTTTEQPVFNFAVMKAVTS